MTNDGLLAVAHQLGVQTLPVVLAVAPQQDSIEAWQTAQQTTLRSLRTQGILDSYDEVADAELAGAMLTLARPERELVARIFTADGIRRVCLARRGADHAVAVRIGEDIDVRGLWCDGSGPELARPILQALGACPPADIVSFSAPSEDLAERLDAARESADYTQIAYTLGIEERDAVQFGLTLAGCHTHTEIVAFTHEDASTTQSSGSVAVYDTARGRIVAVPSQSPDHQAWSTFAPGTDHRLAQAITALIETLPGERWMP